MALGGNTLIQIELNRVNREVMTLAMVESNKKLPSLDSSLIYDSNYDPINSLCLLCSLAFGYLLNSP